MHESVGEGEDRHLVLERCPETAMYVYYTLKYNFIVPVSSGMICIGLDFCMEPHQGGATQWQREARSRNNYLVENY